MLLWVLFLGVTGLAAWLLYRLVAANDRANERSRILLQNASDGIHITDADGAVIEASDAFCRMLGRSRSEVVGMQVGSWDACHSEDALRARMSELLASSEVHTFETAHRRKDGSAYPVEVTSFPLEVDGQDGAVQLGARHLRAQVGGGRG